MKVIRWPNFRGQVFLKHHDCPSRLSRYIFARMRRQQEFQSVNVWRPNRVRPGWFEVAVECVVGNNGKAA